MLSTSNMWDDVKTSEDAGCIWRGRKMLASRLFSLPHTCAVRFIQSNLDKRKDARSSEKAALENAITTLKGTPVFQARALVLRNPGERSSADLCSTHTFQKLAKVQRMNSQGFP